MKRILLPALLLGFVSAQAPTPAKLTLGTQATPIQPLSVNGFNLGFNMSVAEAQDAVKSVAPSSLRYPPGNVGDENDLTKSGLQSFLSQLELTGGGVQATVETRVFATRPEAKNRPEDAAQAARDAQALGLKVTYWEIGNEPDLYATNRGRPEWTPQKYCEVFRAQRQAILKVDPQARFAGPAVSNVNGNGKTFLTGFVKGCGDIVDILTWHEYPSDGSLDDETALSTAPRVTAHLQEFRALLKSQDGNPLGYTRDIKLGVTEYGLSYRTDRAHHLSDQVAALWAAETTLRLAEGGADLSQYFALIGSGNHGLVDQAGFPRPTLYAYQQTRHFQGEALPLTTDNPALWTHAARQDRLLTVLVTNTATSAQGLAPNLPGYTLIGGKTFTEKTVHDEADFIRLPLSGTLNLPARSLTRLVYKEQP